MSRFCVTFPISGQICTILANWPTRPIYMSVNHHHLNNLRSAFGVQSQWRGNWKCQQSNYSPRTEGRRGSWKASKLRHLVIGQEEAIQQIVRAYQTYLALAGLSPVGRPIANFLFLGPTGSGKTRIAVATAESLLQNSRAVIKIDCAEFQHSHDRQVDRVALEARYRAPARATIVEPDGQRPDSRRRLHPREPRGRVSCSRVWP